MLFGKCSSEAVLATDPFCWLDLKLDEHEATFPKAEWFYKIEDDPQIREGKLGGKWQKIDYLLSVGISERA